MPKDLKLTKWSSQSHMQSCRLPADILKCIFLPWSIWCHQMDSYILITNWWDHFYEAKIISHYQTCPLPFCLPRAQEILLEAMCEAPAFEVATEDTVSQRKPEVSKQSFVSTSQAHHHHHHSIFFQRNFQQRLQTLQRWKMQNIYSYVKTLVQVRAGP